VAGGGARQRAGGDAAVLGRPARLAAVERARALLASSAIPLDRIARLAAAGGHAPVGVISLLDAEREYFVATHGTAHTEVPVSLSLCQHVVNTDLPLVIDDVDGADAPPVPPAVRAAGVGAYAGYPVHLSGAAIGAVCVADPDAHHWTAEELTAISDAASTVTALLAQQNASATLAPADPRPPAEVMETIRNRAFLDALLGSLDTAVVACDARGRLIMFNRQMREISGDMGFDTPDDWPNRHDAHHPDGRPMRTAELPLMRALAGEQVHSVPMLMRSTGEPDRHYVCNGRQLRADDGAVVGAVMAVHEVTEIVRASRFKDCEVAVARVLEGEPPLAEAGRRLLQLIIETLQWPFAELWLRSGEQSESADLRRWATAAATAGPDGPDLPPVPGNRLARLATEQGHLTWADGESGGAEPRPTLAVPIRSAERTLGVLIMFASSVHEPREPLEDLLSGIAAHVATFLERRRATQLAQALARSKDEYIGLVGHEMRTPLTSISAYTDLVLEDPALADDLRPMLAVVQRNAATLRGIIANLLDLAALDSGHAQIHRNPTDLSDVVETGVRAAIERAGVDVPSVTAEITAGARVPGDAPRLRQVVDNLLSNALKYTPADGPVVVRLRADDANATLDVADTGMGIPVAERTNLFRRFFRGRAAKSASIPGSGLGLAISRAIVEAHDGTLELVDRPGPGTTFRLTLPVAPSAEPPDVQPA
jgi:signal transduction histidine kinase